MSDRIIVKDLVVFAYHGVHPEEQRLGQRFEVDLSCAMDLREAAKRDTEGATVSYSSLVKIVEEISSRRTFFLIEALADDIARTILSRYAQIDAATVTVRKPSAPIPATLGYVAVEVTRDRND
ncbi:MAG: dihydroneopterin aldolase [Hyphomicrobiales bacterium]|nr:dihydroneopterin aldolase [Hyphomicrobiales bacterium]